MGPQTVFVGDDHVLGETLDAVAGALSARGYRIVRGAAQPAPAHTEYPPRSWPELFGQASAMLVSTRTRVPARLLASAPLLRGVVFPSIGTESVDLAAATRLGIVVAHGATPENFQSMAEATVMLAVALLLELPVRQQQFASRAARPATSTLTSRMLAGRTVGLVGFGRIAQEVVTRLDGWRVGRILAHTRTPPPRQCWPQVSFVDLGTLLEHSDVVSLHLPLTPETRALIGAAELARMGPGSVLINTARGGIVDEAALAHALTGGALGGAAVDTFAHEPPPADHPLRGCPNVILTDHIVGHTRELFDSLVPAAVDNITRLLSGRPPRHLRNPQVLEHPRWRAASPVEAAGHG
jgi:D-3-phosphoglycerate dehydrogenase